MIHLIRLDRDLRALGVRTSLALLTGHPFLEVRPAAAPPVRIEVIRRDREWWFTWRPWWRRLRRPGRITGEWVCADVRNAGDIILSEVSP
ncbi:hypothetical protein [Streptosporangium sp. KLBMP 9127]|nr:hypothetical protein [Streptosporangium sp. KLBMP 9127]